MKKSTMSFVHELRMNTFFFKSLYIYVIDIFFNAKQKR